MIFSLNFQTWILTVLLMSPVAGSQSVPTRASQDQIDHWLRSGDPRLVAWGATFAASTADTAELPVLQGLAETYNSVPPQEYDPRGNYIPRTPEQKQQLDSMQAILDALIQLHGTLSFEGVEAALPDFPAQALVLFATMPEPERSRYALRVYEARDKSDQTYNWRHLVYQQMVHLAAAILALNPPPGFTATLLNETRITLKVAVTDDDRQRDGTFSGAMCGDSFALSPADGWPQPYTYVVEQHWQSPGTAEGILVPGVPTITSRRALSSSSCSTLSGFTSVQKLLLARQEAGMQSEGRNVGTLQYDSLHYRSAADFATSLAALVARHQEPFHKLRGALLNKSFITTPEAENAMPAFAVEIDDQRKDKSQPLSIPRSLGPRTTVSPYKAETGWFVKQD
jgi:hypothetical protein